MRNVAIALLVTGMVAAALPARAGGLSASERRMVNAVHAAVPGATALLERLVNQNSGTNNRAGVRAVADLLRPRLDALGFRTRWVDGAAWERAGHLVAERPSTSARVRLLLIGHLDTVFEPDSPFQSFRRLDDSTASGPGVADMKGGDVVILLALEALKAAGELDRFDVRVVYTGDEERAGRPVALSRADLLEAARDRDVALDFEDGAGAADQAVTARRSSGDWTLRVAGHPAHSSQIFRETVGAGAVYEAARILDGIRDSLSAQPHLTINAGLVLGGTRVDMAGGRGSASGKVNVVPESVLVAGDLRALTLEQVEDARATMRRIVARHLPLTDAAIEFADGYPPMAPGPGRDALLAILDGASRDLGWGPVHASNPDDLGASDLSWVADRVPMALDGLGIGGAGGHTVHEVGDLRGLERSGARVAVLLSRLAATRKAVATR